MKEVSFVTDKEKQTMDEEDEKVVVVTDEEGNEFYYQEEMIIPVGEDKYALLLGIHEEEEEHVHSEDCGCEDEDDVIVAKIVLDEKGEEEYVEPTDEEYEAVQKAYDAIMDEEEAKAKAEEKE